MSLSISCSSSSTACRVSNNNVSNSTSQTTTMSSMMSKDFVVSRSTTRIHQQPGGNSSVFLGDASNTIEAPAAKVASEVETPMMEPPTPPPATVPAPAPAPMQPAPSSSSKVAGSVEIHGACDALGVSMTRKLRLAEDDGTIDFNGLSQLIQEHSKLGGSVTITLHSRPVDVLDTLEDVVSAVAPEAATLASHQSVVEDAGLEKLAASAVAVIPAILVPPRKGSRIGAGASSISFG